MSKSLFFGHTQHKQMIHKHWVANSTDLHNNFYLRHRARHRSPRQRTALGKEVFAEGTALGKDRPTANQIFAEGLGPRQRCPRQSRPIGVTAAISRQTLPRATR